MNWSVSVREANKRFRPNWKNKAANMSNSQQDASRQGIEAECQMRKGDPFEEIIAAAHKLKADLIVMRHTGRRGTTRVLIGSVTKRVLDYAPCPVLVVKQVDHASR